MHIVVRVAADYGEFPHATSDKGLRMHIDVIDRKILRAMQSNCRISADDLSQTCGASPSTVLRRLNRLRAAGVIVEETATVDPKKVGRPLLMVVSVRLDRDNATAAEAFVRQLREHSAVMQAYFVTGSADYIIHISARDMDEYSAFVQTLVANPYVVLTETNVVISAIKVGLRVPIED
jgi:Lrp/AsnC family transcriptional regulator, leucine-responsive regulatory protein